MNLDGSLSLLDRITRADVSLKNGALVDVTAAGGGEIAIVARNLDLSTDSRLRSGIAAGLGSAQARAGDITIQSAETVTLQGSSIESSVASGGIGKGGDIVINARSLFVTRSSVLSCTSSEGVGGNLTANATDLVQLVGTVADAQFSGLNAFTKNRGNEGNISIDKKINRPRWGTSRIWYFG